MQQVVPEREAVQRPGRGSSYGRALKSAKQLSLQNDPGAVVQTGEGVPRWSAGTAHLAWSGPVRADQAITLFLAGPGLGLVAALARVALLVLMALKLSDLPLPRPRGGRRAAAILLLAASGLAAGPDALAGGTPPPSAPSILDELEARLAQPPPCSPDCVEVPLASIRIGERPGIGSVLTLDAEVHAAADAGWALPGPASTWDRLLLDGLPTTAAARRDGALVVRVPAGIHHLVAESRLVGVDVLSLQVPDPPRRLEFAAAGWTVQGLRTDGTVEGSLQIVRAVPSAEGGAAPTDRGDLTPWVRVERFLDLGVPWRVRTTVRLLGDDPVPASLRVPLLPGEQVTSEEVEVRDGAAQVQLDAAHRVVTWVSALTTAERIELEAGPPAWSVTWQVSCSPVFRCRHDGPPPVVHVEDGRWLPTWKPWPGERLVLEVSRPEGAPGASLTVEEATLRWTPGRRSSEGELTLEIRASQGAQHPVQLPEGARLVEARVDGEPAPLQADAGRVALPVQPGAHRFTLRWQQDEGIGPSARVPEVDLGVQAANVMVRVAFPADRWLLALRGPSWGPKPLVWTWLVVIALAAPLLARIPWVTLKAHQWALLGLGMTQLPVPAAVYLVLWFVAVGWLGQGRFRGTAGCLPAALLIPATLAAAGVLYAAVQAGLLFPFDAQVAGNGSTNTALNWYVDRSSGTLPTPTVFSLPGWTWRVVMLAWSLWLASEVVRWARWAWSCWTVMDPHLPRRRPFHLEEDAEQPPRPDPLAGEE